MFLNTSVEKQSKLNLESKQNNMCISTKDNMIAVLGNNGEIMILEFQEKQLAILNQFSAYSLSFVGSLKHPNNVDSNQHNRDITWSLSESGIDSDLQVNK